MPPSTLRLHHGAILGSAAIRITVSSYRQPRPPPQRRLPCRYGHYNFNCNCSTTTTTILRHRQPLLLQRRRRRQQQQHHLRAFTAQAPSSSSSFFSPAARSTGIHSLFQRIETNYGNLSSLIDTGSRGETIAVEDGIIRPHHLVRLMTHEATALHIHNFYDAECAKRLGCELSMMNNNGEYPQQQQGGIGSVGVGNGHGGGSGRKNWKINTPRGLESSDVMTVGEHMPYNVAYSSSSSSSVAMQDNHHRSGKKHVGGPSGLGRGGGDSSSDHPMIPSPIDEYFEGVQRELRLRRQLKKVVVVNDNSSSNNDQETHHCYHPLWPLDKLRLELEEAWPSGAGLAREGQPTKQRMTATETSDNNTGSTDNERYVRYPRPYGGGLPRIMQGPTRWKRGFIHVDELGPLDDTRGLFSANIYLTVPESLSLGSIDSTSSDHEDWKKDAGALHVWPLGVRSRWDWYRNAVTLSSLSSQDPELQHNLRVKLGKPNVIRPEPGDLVLLCAQRPHCAVGFERGVRVSLQCFLSHSGLDKRLLIDC